MNIERELISVVITTYDRFDEAKRAICSVTNQIYRPIEIIVVEDGSRSGLEKWISEVRVRDDDVTIKYLNNDKNLGIAATKNNGIRAASGEYIAILDDDDEWKSDKLLRQMQEMRKFLTDHPGMFAIATSGLEVRDSEGKVEYTAPCGNLGRLREDIVSNGLKTPSSTFFFPRKKILELGGYDESLKSSLDHDIIMVLALAGFYGIAVQSPLVINYSRVGRNTNMTNTVQRLDSVKQFLEKWSSTFETWLGNKKARKFHGDYFAKVGTMLFINKLLSKNFGEAAYCLRQIFSNSGLSISVFKIVLVPTLKSLVKIFIPSIFVRKIKGLS